MNLFRLSSSAVLALAALIAPPRAASAQPTPADTVSGVICPEPSSIDFGIAGLTGNAADFARAAELAGAAPLRSRLNRRTSTERRLQICAPAGQIPWAGSLGSRAPAAGLSVEVLYPTLRTTRNSAYPDSRNNGALWAGRGLGAELAGGIAFEWGPLSGAVAPSLVYQENRDFEMITSIQPPGYSPYIYPWRPGTIDWPQRFGDLRLLSASPGQSYLQFEHRGMTLALSTENLWWGPAQRNPLILSNTAPGFTHLALGTARPHDLRIGAVEAQAIWGRLEESPHFDGEVANDGRLFAGFVANIQPYALPGLFLGFARAHILELDGLGYHRQAFAPFWTMGGRTEDGSDHPGYQLISLSARWVFPDAGFEAYTEWASRARWSGLKDLLREPGRDQAYLFGFQYLVPTGESWVRAYGETSILAGSPKLPREGSTTSFYTDRRITQGHTHRGHLLGAAIGPGADGQILGLDLFTGWGAVGLFAERTRYDVDAYYLHWTKYYGPSAHDIAIAGGLHQLFFFGDYSIGWKVRYESRRNRNFIGVNGFNWDLLTERNWGIHLEAGWRPGTLRPTFAARRS